MGYSISLRSLDARLTREARVTLRGIAGAQVVPAGSSYDKGDSRESFTITPGLEPRAMFDSAVYAGKITGVRWVEVDEVTYADGTEWRQAGVRCAALRRGGFLR